MGSAAARTKIFVGWATMHLAPPTTSKTGVPDVTFYMLNAPNSFLVGNPAQTPLGELKTLPKPLAVFKGSTSKRREGRTGETKGGGKVKGREVEGGIWPTQKFWGAPTLLVYWIWITYTVLVHTLSEPNELSNWQQ